jgi:hypothetical protein
VCCAIGVSAPGYAQEQNVPAPAQRAQGAVERAVHRFGVGVEAGVGLDPELVVFGGHGTFGPIFSNAVEFRPGLEAGIGEVTTFLGINLDVLYRFPGSTAQTPWQAYIGAGPTFGLSHRGFQVDEADNVNTPGVDRNRFDFSDTDFNRGMNFIAGARNQRGVFFEMRTTAWGVSNLRLLGGFDF